MELTLLVDKVTNIGIDCGQTSVTLEGVSTEAVADQLTAHDIVWHSDSNKLVAIMSEIITTHGREYLQDIIEQAESEL